MSDLTLWGLFLAAGLGTFALRLCFVELHGRFHMPELLRRALLYVPASVLAALVLPAVVFAPGQTGLALDNPQIPAALIATLVAWKTRSTLLTLSLGMAALWGFKLLGL